MLATIAWWLAISTLGWLTWPLFAVLFRHSPGKGYAYARALGLLLLSYAYWLLGMLGALPNAVGALWSVAFLLAVASVLLWYRKRTELTAYLRCEWPHILTVELLFLSVLTLYALHKAYDPAINHTEEPMDFAFLNACLRSPRMPPDDPWLAGFPISYYYLGYLIVSVVTRLTGLPSGVGYNLGLASTLALTVTASYGLLRDLFDLHAVRAGARNALTFGLLGAIAIAMMGNLEGLFELTWALGIGPQAFYRWLDVPGLLEAAQSGSWLPDGNWWWWRASRIISDRNFLGKLPTVITEFPAFSFILGDLHPHVMSLPYMLLALGVAVELYMTGRMQREHAWWRQWRCWAIPWVLGALGFLNTWDLPTFLAIAWLAFALGRSQGAQPRAVWVRDCLTLGLWMVAGSLLLYLPFYLKLNSQAQGIGLVHYTKTRLTHYLLCLGVWLLPVVVDAFERLIRLQRQDSPAARWRTLLGIWTAVWLIPWLGTLLLGGWGRTLLALVSVVMVGPWLLLLQSVLLTAFLAVLWHAWHVERDAGLLLSLGLSAVGVGLTYATEFYYLRDLFDTRMNTMFKVYYQAWVLLGVGAVLAAWRMWRAGGWRFGALALLGLLVCASLYYPLAAAYTRAGGYRGEATLDGTAFLANISPAEYGAYRWLVANAGPMDVLVEGVGQDYVADHNRLSSWTGVPTILGWPGHEVQWRGDDTEVRRRMRDLEVIHTGEDEKQVLTTLDKYGASLLYVGPYEMQKYGIRADRLAWYANLFEQVYAEGDSRLFRTRP